MESLRRLLHPLATLRTCILVAGGLVAIGCESRKAEVATLTAEDAKTALIQMLRREAVRDPSRCREVWGSTEVNHQLATKPIEMNSSGTIQIWFFTVRLDKQNYFFWEGPNLLEGSFKWEQGGWRASECRLTAHGDNFGRGGRKQLSLACD